MRARRVLILVLGVLGVLACGGARDPRCALRPSPGLCLGLLTQYYFDAKTGRCAPAVWGGCNDVVVPFKALEDCQAVCEAK